MLAIALLAAGVGGGIAMVATGLYPLDILWQVKAIVVGTPARASRSISG
jgi:hypothetical protein